MIKEILLRRKIPLLLVLALTFGVLGRCYGQNMAHGGKV